VDTATLAKMTDGYSGSDLRLVIREAVLNALLENRKELCHQDLLNSIDDFRQRISDYKRSIEA
jgi:ATP-dependent 26S proteasome regulatory subunit